MADNFKDDDNLSDHWLTNWEQKTVEGWDSDSSLEERTQTENDRCKQKLWTSFQNSASSIAQLYKDGCEGNRLSLWLPFQNSASAVTIMYKDSLDAMKKCFELGSQYATKRQRKEMLSWAKKRKRHMHREELIGYMCGKPPPPPHACHSRNGAYRTSASGRYVGNTSPRQAPRVPHPHHQSSESSPQRSAVDPSTADLQPFCDALALQRLDGAMSSFGLETQRTSQSEEAGRTSSRSHSPDRGVSANSGSSMTDADFHLYLLNELSRRQEQVRKRQAGVETGLDSPTRKRSRLSFRDNP